ncbi:MAG: lectin-like protein, partial [Saprospiraceae bacterium]
MRTLYNERTPFNFKFFCPSGRSIYLNQIVNRLFMRSRSTSLLSVAMPFLMMVSLCLTTTYVNAESDVLLESTMLYDLAENTAEVNEDFTCPGSISFWIYNTDTYQRASGIGQLTNNIQISLSQLPSNYYIVTELGENNHNAEDFSVTFKLNGIAQNCENAKPYTWPNGAEQASENAWNGGTGTYTLNATSYKWQGCNSGEFCEEKTITITIKDSNSCNDFSVSLGSDMTICAGETVTISAEISGETNCDCCIRTVTNTDHCNNSQWYAIYFDRKHYQANNDMIWEECGDGTARLTGTANNGSQQVSINIIYSGYSTNTPAGSPKENQCQWTSDNGWVYYTDISGTITQNGNVYSISRRGPAFQMGYGANVTGSINKFGGSGWFNANSGGYSIVGDVNIHLDSNCSNGGGSSCSDQNISEMNYLGSYGNSSYYIKYSGDLQYDQAKSFVQSKGGQLPKIETQGENNWLANQISGSIWLGLTDSQSEGTWRWHDNEIVSYTNWARGEPSSSHGEDYARMKTDGEWTDRKSGEWFWVVMELECNSSGGGGNNDDVTYRWSNGSTSPSITINPISTQTYTVTVTGCDGCEDSDSKTIFVNGEFSCPPDVTIECDESKDPDNTGRPALTCDPNAVITYMDEESGTCPLYITRTWTASITRSIDNPCISQELAHWNFSNANTKCYNGVEPLDPSQYYGDGVEASYVNSNQCGLLNISSVENRSQSSCVRGAFGSSEGAICVKATTSNSFVDNDMNSITFSIQFGSQDEGRLTGISFYQRVDESNENFSWVDYAQKFGFRVLKNNVEILQIDNKNTSYGQWKHEYFEFTGDDFSYSGSTTFKIEILGYDATNYGQSKRVWEFDELKVFGCCGTETSNETETFTCEQKIIINDTQTPTLTGVPNDISISCEDEIPEVPNSIVASDNCFFVSIFKEETLQGPFTCPVIGQIKRIWTVTDDCNNEINKFQIISILDEEAPEIQNPPNDVTIECGDPIPPYTPLWEDNCSTITESAKSSITIDGCREIQEFTFTATDECGNSTEVIRIITIDDTTSPFFDGLIPDKEISCDEDLVFGTPAFGDNCSTPTLTFDDENIPGDCENEFEIKRTWTVTDECGNTATTSATISVVDRDGPQIDCPDDQVVQLDDDCTADVDPSNTGEPTVSDNC